MSPNTQLLTFLIVSVIKFNIVLAYNKLGPEIVGEYDTKIVVNYSPLGVVFNFQEKENDENDENYVNRENVNSLSYPNYVYLKRDIKEGYETVTNYDPLNEIPHATAAEVTHRAVKRNDYEDSTNDVYLEECCDEEQEEKDSKEKRSTGADEIKKSDNVLKDKLRSARQVDENGEIIVGTFQAYTKATSQPSLPQIAPNALFNEN
ncbi:hypothetical protein EVAR_11632_1 [Eumeta japonica]|uniref:Uncharacterized protein n=1 Tax=Eumeta variegata TaxID=151549 RepID=A0A4C1WVH2_EUMVA|nr:hypothetical protein EVAR_11632_1 [Eumeta japonica]